MKYKVTIVRVGYRGADIEVEAATPEDAKKAALDKAGDAYFSSEYEAEYEVENVEVME